MAGVFYPRSGVGGGKEGCVGGYTRAEVVRQKTCQAQQHQHHVLVFSKFVDLFTCRHRAKNGLSYRPALIFVRTTRGEHRKGWVGCCGFDETAKEKRTSIIFDTVVLGFGVPTMSIVVVSLPF